MTITLVVGLSLLLLIAINFHFYRMRKAMSPKQRREDDETIREDLQIW